ncbi:MAG TPA: small ribosomal subunit Rsm22 family protein [Gammaproteobacteria bacterium]|nr:small ribosomal subunit Rsm22 family protein [Gammaproteobacteria bacterium]
MHIEIEALAKDIPVTMLQQAAAELSARYRANEMPYLTTHTHYLAYLITRMPATYAALCAVFKQAGQCNPRSMLDLGAGPGTGYFAAKAYFPDLAQVTLLEADPKFIRLGQQLITDSVLWQQASLPCQLVPHDLVLLSYSLNEMTDPAQIVQAAWQATQQLLVIIEPGTPHGYQRIIAMRDLLLSMDAHIIAPCPNALPCPMQAGNWCHFPARLSRSKLHRQLKGGELGFEDEKFSYLIVAKEAHPIANARIVAPKQTHKGHLQLTLCMEGELKSCTVSQKDKALYKKCRKVDWGDSV